MNEPPILSIVTPTRGNFADYWLEEILKVEENVEFIFVYPPNVRIKPSDEPRFSALVSPDRGEVIPRFTGLINANGAYVLALDDDDFVPPKIAQLVRSYFPEFTESLVGRLTIENISFNRQELIQRDWSEIPDIRQLEIGKKNTGKSLPIPKWKIFRFSRSSHCPFRYKI